MCFFLGMCREKRKGECFMKCLSRWLFAVAVAVVLCAGMWGCTDVDYHLSESRTGAKVVGFIDDSLVMVTDYRYWYEYTDTWYGQYSEKSGCKDTRLCVYNYRVQEEGPRWCDSVDGKTDYTGQFSDSIVWSGLYGARNSLILWKAGENFRHYFSFSVVNEGCNTAFDAAFIHQWFDGKFIVIGKQSLTAGNDSCRYAVLDTVGRTLVYKRLEENLKWIEKCDDVRAWGEDVYCLLRKKENWSVLLSVDNIVVDSMEFDEERRYAVYPALFAGNMLHMGDYICSLTNKKMERKPYVKSLSDLKFINADESIVSY